MSGRENGERSHSSGNSRPPIRPPTSGASQNSHSWPGAPSPLKKATPVERAGFTEVFEIGIEIRWIRVSDRPIARPAKPIGARPWVAPRMMITKNAVRITSARATAPRLYRPGELSP